MSNDYILDEQQQKYEKQALSEALKEQVASVINNSKSLEEAIDDAKLAVAEMEDEKSDPHYDTHFEAQPASTFESNNPQYRETYSKLCDKAEVPPAELPPIVPQTPQPDENDFGDPKWDDDREENKLKESENTK